MFRVKRFQNGKTEPVYGNFDKAEDEASQFSWRGITSNGMLSYLNHAKKDYLKESVHCQYDIVNDFYHMIHTIMQNGKAYLALDKADDVIVCFNKIMELIDTVFGAEDILPPVHITIIDHTGLLLAKAYLKKADFDSALREIKRSVEYELNSCTQFEGKSIKSPLLCNTKYPFYGEANLKSAWKFLDNILFSDDFAKLEGIGEFDDLIIQIRNALDA